jgi:hypothetical protein
MKYLNVSYVHFIALHLSYQLYKLIYKLSDLWNVNVRT